MSKFKLGQSVKLTSKLSPAANGVYKISGVFPPAENVSLLRDGSNYSGYCYGLEGTNLFVAEHALSAVN